MGEIEMDYYLGKYTVAKDLKPIWTVWKHTEVTKDIKAHKRKTRRSYRQYLKTGDVRQFNKSQRKITRWDFD
jgi:hypothetical protein